MPRRERILWPALEHKRFSRTTGLFVWHLDLEPGEQGERHTHELDYVVRVLSGSTLEVSGPDGELLPKGCVSANAKVCKRCLSANAVPAIKGIEACQLAKE